MADTWTGRASLGREAAGRDGGEGGEADLYWRYSSPNSKLNDGDILRSHRLFHSSQIRMSDKDKIQHSHISHM